MSLSLSPSPSSPPPPPTLSRHHHPFLPLVEQCATTHHLKQIHALAIRTSPTAPTPQFLFLYTRILHSATTLNDLHYASLLLDHPIPPNTPNSFAYNTLIRALSRSSNPLPPSLSLFTRMLSSPSAPPDHHTFPFLLKSCASLSALPEGSQLHSHLTKLGLASDVYVVNSLIHFYSSCGLPSVARQLFDGMPRRSPVSWNVIIDAHVVNADYAKALALFRSMQDEFAPDVFALQSLIVACSALGALSLVMWAHSFLLRRRGESASRGILIENSLIDAYAKCGSISLARQVFDGMLSRDVASWNVMIQGLAMHGCVDESLGVFGRMLMEGPRPNSITFVSVLSACNHGGLVEECREYFWLMVDEFGVEPQLEHYGCMVDLLARVGFMDEALDVVLNRMPFKPDVVIWRSLVDACCRNNSNIQVSEMMGKWAVESEVDSSGAYVLLSKVYALAERWDDVGLVRRLMSEKGIRKEPGCSSIEMDGVVHEFVAGDTSHCNSKEIYDKLDEVEQRLASLGYRPDSTQASMVADVDGAKGSSLRHHSERLALAFGLQRMVSGTPIRILKNLRICGDCHHMTKLVSHVYHVEIFMRDRIRFHHFKDGSCSCKDYW